MGKHRHNSCPLCSTENTTPMKRYARSFLQQCTKCSFVFSGKYPDADTLNTYYQKNYDLTRYFSSITRNRYLEILEEFEPFRKTNRILDIGCGYGFFLEVAKEKGWEVYGIELSKIASEECRQKGINIFHGNLTDFRFDADAFDVIVSIEVIEHLSHPNLMLKQANKLLRKGGLVYITTPNFNSYLRHKLKESYNIIDYPNHLCYFTNKTLKKAFENQGFKSKYINSTGISITRSKTSRGKSNQKFVSETSDDEMLRYRIENNSGLRYGKKIANDTLNFLKIGESLKGAFIKS